MGTDRKPIGRKTRFEVFKRDKFTCQYCGRMAPDVVLEVDHIKPVASGGTNELMNLVTSCRECNRGKGRTEISDDSVLKKQQAMLEEFAEKNEQLEMMVQWKDELLKLDDRKAKFISDYMEKQYGSRLTEKGIKSVKMWLKKYSVEELIAAMDESFSNPYNKFSEDAFDEIPKIAYYKKNPIPQKAKQVMYLRKILINRLSYVDKTKAYEILDYTLYEYGCSFEDVKKICCICRSWTDFKNRIAELIEDEGY